MLLLLSLTRGWGYSLINTFKFKKKKIESAFIRFRNTSAAACAGCWMTRMAQRLLRWARRDGWRGMHPGGHREVTTSMRSTRSPLQARSSARPLSSASTVGGRADAKTVGAAASASTSGRGAGAKTLSAAASASTSGRGEGSETAVAAACVSTRGKQVWWHTHAQHQRQASLFSW